MPKVLWIGALSLTFCALVEARQARGKTDYTEWNSWTGFAEGAWVTIEKDFRGQSKTSFTLTLTKKTVDALTVKQTDEPRPKRDDVEVEGPLTVPGLPFENGEWHYVRNPKPLPCPTCGAVHKESLVAEHKKEKVKVADKELLCQVLEVIPFDCNGVKEGTSLWWLSRDVPGWLVKREFKAEGKPGKVVDSVLDFGKTPRAPTPDKK